MQRISLDDRNIDRSAFGRKEFLELAYRILRGHEWQCFRTIKDIEHMTLEELLDTPIKNTVLEAVMIEAGSKLFAGKTVGSVMNAVGLTRDDVYRLVGRTAGESETIYGAVAAQRVSRAISATA